MNIRTQQGFLSMVISAALMTTSVAMAQNLAEEPKPEDLTLPRCLAGAFELPGQGWLADFSEGGVTMMADARQAHLPSATEIYGKDFSTKAGESNLVIFDNFDLTEILLDETGSGHPKSLKLRHGNIVLAHVLTLLGNAEFKINMSQKDHIVATRNGTTINIYRLRFPMDSNGLHPADSAAGILESFFGKTKINLKITTVNMSFVMIPCYVMKAYMKIKNESNGKRLVTFAEFIAENPNTIPFHLYAEPSNNKLLKMIREYGKKGVRFVIASGNHGLKEPLWPGRDPYAISVGASEFTNINSKIFWSNSRVAPCIVE